MTARGPIAPTLEGRGRFLDRRDERLPTAWIAGPPRSLPTTHELVRDAEQPVSLEAGDGPVLAMLSGDCPAVERTLLDAARRGARVYVLAPAGWGDGARGPLSEVPHARVLARRAAHLPASAVWSRGDAWVWLGEDATRPSWRLRLDAPQSAALRIAYLRIFWGRALDEGWNRDGRLTFGPCAEAPYDLPVAVPEAAVALIEGQAEAPPGSDGSTFYLPAHAPPPGSARRVWFPASGRHHEALDTLVRAGTTVTWDALGLPACVLDARRCVTTPSSPGWMLRIQMNDVQRRELTALLEGNGRWAFRRDVPLREIEAVPGAQVLLAGSDAPATLVPGEEHDAGEVRAASLRDAPGVAPEAWPPPSPLALSASWRWRVVLPQAPKGASEDPLVVAWRRTDERAEALVQTTRARLVTSDQGRERLAREYEELGAAMIGVERTCAALRERLDDLAGRAPSALGPDRAPGHFEALRAVAEEATQVALTLDDAERKARESREREAQRRAYEQGRRQAETDLAGYRQELEQRRSSLEDVERQLRELAAGEVNAAATKDHKVARSRLRDDRERTAKRIERLEGLLRDCEGRLAREFEYQPRAPAVSAKGAGAGVSFVPAAPEERTRPPGESLPTVGRLVTASKQRYLAIGRWDELDDGEREAARLGAQLVADVEGA